MDARIFDWLTTVLFVVMEAAAVAFAYTHTRRSNAPFAFFAYFLPFLAFMPWLAGKNLSKALGRHLAVSDSAVVSTISVQVSIVVTVAYLLFGMALIMPDLLKVS